MRRASPMRARRRAIVLRAGGQWQSPALRSIAIAFLRLSLRALRQCLSHVLLWPHSGHGIRGFALTIRPIFRANGLPPTALHLWSSMPKKSICRFGRFQIHLDTNDKTISYTFVDLTGGGSYEFSRDRATLTITESDGSQTVFQKYSDSTDGEPRVLSADEAAALMNAGQSQENATAQGSGDSSKATGEVSAETSGEAASDSAAQTETTGGSASAASSAPR